MSTSKLIKTLLANGHISTEELQSLTSDKVSTADLTKKLKKASKDPAVAGQLAEINKRQLDPRTQQYIQKRRKKQQAQRRRQQKLQVTSSLEEILRQHQANHKQMQKRRKRARQRLLKKRKTISFQDYITSLRILESEQTALTADEQQHHQNIVDTYLYLHQQETLRDLDDSDGDLDSEN